MLAVNCCCWLSQQHDVTYSINDLLILCYSDEDGADVIDHSHHKGIEICCGILIGCLLLCLCFAGTSFQMCLLVNSVKDVSASWMTSWKRLTTHGVT